MAGQFKSRHSRPAALPYSSMSMNEIAKLPVSQVVNPGAHVYLWCTNKTLESAFKILQNWGVHFHQVLVTVKTSGMTPSLGYVFGTEFCLLGFAGRPMQKFTSIGALNWWQDNPRYGRHTYVFYERVKRMSPGPYADLFARQPREGWAIWGDEVDSDEQLQRALGYTPGSPNPNSIRPGTEAS